MGFILVAIIKFIGRIRALSTPLAELVFGLVWF